MVKTATMGLWNSLVRPVLFQFPPEAIHHASMGVHATGCRVPGVPAFWRWASGAIEPRLGSQCLGLQFRSPVGLAAGFDKDARWFTSLGLLGFGAIEAGSITALPQPGNSRPRLFRLPADQALINRMGFNSAGAEAVAGSLAIRRRELDRFRERHVLGINLGKSKVTPLEEAASDYEQSLRRLYEFGDYFVVNVSSPNTAGLRDLQQQSRLAGLIEHVAGVMDQLSAESGSPRRPLLVKIAPDLSSHELDEVIEVIRDSPVAGVIASNTTVSRDGLQTPAGELERIGAGGLSGRPLHQRSVAMVARVFAALRGTKPVIGVGGVFDGDDVWRMMGAGASLVQLYTGFIYGGPLVVGRIHRRLVQLMEQNRIATLAEWIGRDQPLESRN